MSIISVQNLCKSFNGFAAVKNVDFEVQEGEIFGFLGPNGAGKTTTIRMLCTLLNPTSGKALVCGFDVTKYQKDVRQNIGIIFQDPSLDDRLTADENLHFHCILYKVPRHVRKQRMEDALEIVGLSKWRHERVRIFSGGMKRRLEIARGLLHTPKVLFLDEPTLGLDPQTRKQIWDHIVSLRKKDGMTLFLTTHYMEEAENCDRIAVIDHGQIVACDTPPNLKKNIHGDILHVIPVYLNSMQTQIEEQFHVPVHMEDDELLIEVENAGEFIPKLAQKFGEQIKSITYRRVSLDDVFLKLTGRQIREEEAGSKDFMRGIVKRHNKT